MKNLQVIFAKLNESVLSELKPRLHLPDLYSARRSCFLVFMSLRFALCCSAAQLHQRSSDRRSHLLFAASHLRTAARVPVPDSCVEVRLWQQQAQHGVACFTSFTLKLNEMFTCCTFALTASERQQKIKRPRGGGAKLFVGPQVEANWKGQMGGAFGESWPQKRTRTDLQRCHTLFRLRISKDPSGLVGAKPGGAPPLSCQAPKSSNLTWCCFISAVLSCNAAL